MGVTNLFKPKLVVFVPILLVYFFVSAIIMFYTWSVVWKSAPNTMYVLGGLGLASSLVLIALLVYIILCLGIYCVSKIGK